jgi:hypothetical protein
MPDDSILGSTARRLSQGLLVGVLIAVLSAAPAWGRSLSSEPLPSGLSFLSGISCVGIHCVAVGGTAEPTASAGAVVSTDGGKSWSNASIPHGIAALYGVSCSSASRCWAVGELSGGGHAGAVVTSSDGGRSWIAQTFPTGVATATSIACVGSSCIATGIRIGSALVTHDGGADWSLRPLLPPCKAGFCAGATADAVTFPTSSVAFAAGGDQCGGHVTQCPGNIWKTSNGGGSWRMVFNGFPFVDALSCIDASHCWAAAATFHTAVILGSANGGRTWRPQILPSFGGFFNGISCGLVARHHHCIAVGQNEKGTAPVIAETGDGGSQWKLVKAPAGTGPLGGVSLGSTGSARIVGENSGANSALIFGA